MDENTTQTESLNKKSIKVSLKTVIIIAVVIILGILAYFAKGLFIAAMVDGSPISRLAIIRQLEKASGKSLLDALITEKLIQNEAKTKGIKVSDDEINGQISAIRDQLVTQGSTLEATLAAHNMTMEDLRREIILGKEEEKLLADKITVSDDEVAQYIKDNSLTIPKGQEATATAQIKDEIRNQKLSTAGNDLITTLKSQAKIRYFVNY
jgi:hypothetical protein